MSSPTSNETDTMKTNDTRTDAPVAVADHPAPVDLDTTYGEAETHEGTDGAGGLKDKARQEFDRRYDEVQQFAREARDRGTQEAHERLEQARQKIDEAKHQLSLRYERVRRDATSKASKAIDQQKGRVLGGIGDLAAAARAAAEELRNRNDETVAGYAQGAADSLDRVRDYLGNASGKDLAREAAGVTRRQPEWVLGAAFVAGLGISRFLKADQPHARGLPDEADESLYRDVADRQQDHLREDFSSRGMAAGDAPVPGPIPEEDVGETGSSPVGLHQPTGHLPSDGANDPLSDNASRQEDAFVGSPAISTTDDVVDTPATVEEDDPKKTGASNLPPQA
jgi:hypothetical protein